MLVYHGSNSNFRTLRISKSLVKHDSTLENEGLGIYFSSDYDVAASYGKYVYTLDINNNCLFDFRRRGTCVEYLKRVIRAVKSATGIDISLFIDMESVVSYMCAGGIAISGTCRELALLLDSSENWYTCLTEARRRKVLGVLKGFDKKNLKAYFFTYNIKNCGVCKVVTDDVAHIVDKRRV